ncbi:hypothetical protein [Amorphus coralli]|uniref:hypothetical protein n=1 Tax=Amorphus coralli TaxID=340680 RepID=UPI0012EBA133|nr:hypothetical protein [Amorphus coralli]
MDRAVQPSIINIEIGASERCAELGHIHQARENNPLLVGRIASGFPDRTHPLTVAGLNAAAGMAALIVVDRQSESSQGLLRAVQLSV